MMWHYHDGMGWWMIFVGVFWAAVLVAIAWGIRKATSGGDTDPETRGQRHPLEIAKERYARGEISREEFEQIKRDIS